jgi:hypothetical protein
MLFKKNNSGYGRHQLFICLSWAEFYGPQFVLNGMSCLFIPDFELFFRRITKTEIDKIETTIAIDDNVIVIMYIIVGGGSHSRILQSLTPDSSKSLTFFFLEE